MVCRIATAHTESVHRYFCPGKQIQSKIVVLAIIFGVGIPPGEVGGELVLDLDFSPESV